MGPISAELGFSAGGMSPRNSKAYSPATMCERSGSWQFDQDGFLILEDEAHWVLRRNHHASSWPSSSTARDCLRCLWMGNDAETRTSDAVRRLRRGELRAIFTVDIFNEGVDIPEVDTLLLLRPTESATVFLQQLGRGLRWAEGKSVLTVLDFIGQAHAEYRFDIRYRAIDRRHAPTGREGDRARVSPSRRPAVRSDSDEIAQDIVLENLRSSLRNTRRAP